MRKGKQSTHTSCVRLQLLLVLRRRLQLQLQQQQLRRRQLRLPLLRLLLFLSTHQFDDAFIGGSANRVVTSPRACARFLMTGTDSLVALCSFCPYCAWITARATNASLLLLPNLRSVFDILRMLQNIDKAMFNFLFLSAKDEGFTPIEIRFQSHRDDTFKVLLGCIWVCFSVIALLTAAELGQTSAIADLVASGAKLRAYDGVSSK
jgi:hypothetical protein